MNVAAGLAHDGSLVVIASGYSKRNPPGQFSQPHEGKVLAPWVCRSRDGGRTWQRSESIEPFMDGSALVPYGDIVRQTDGDLGVCIQNFQGTSVKVRSGDWEFGSHYYVSKDDGESWKYKATIDTPDLNETTPLVLPDGTLLAVGRTTPARGLKLESYGSRDQGATWQANGSVSEGKQVPGHLLQLRDGQLLLTYGLRNERLQGVAVKLSDDSGQTWGYPRVLTHYDPQVLVNYGAMYDESYLPPLLEGVVKTRDGGGYPSSVQVDDGTIVTAYYCNGIPFHQRYHMGVLRWNAE
jgi:hypothetical protein